MKEELFETRRQQITVARVKTLLPLVEDLASDLEAEGFQIHDLIDSIAHYVDETYPDCDEAVGHLEKAAASLKEYVKELGIE